MRMGRFLLGVALVSTVFAAGVSAQEEGPGRISGTVINEFRTGIPGVEVMMLDLTTLDARWAVTNSFGRFRFDGLAINNQYLIQVQSRRAYFQFPSQVVNMDSVLRAVAFHGIQYPISLPRASLRGF